MDLATNIYEALEYIRIRPKPFEFNTDEAFWNDTYISKKLLALHLSSDNDHASKKSESIKASCNWITTKFNIGKGISVCDFGCGPGLYTTKLAKNGAIVTGIDISNQSIKYAINLANKANIKINYIRNDYLNFKSKEKYDLIIMLNNTFCTLSQKKRQSILNLFFVYLKKNGKVVLEVPSLKQFSKKSEKEMFGHRLFNGFWSENDYYGFLNDYKYDEEKIILQKFAIIEKDRIKTYYNWLKYYSLDSLLLLANGYFQTLPFHISNFRQSRSP